MPEIYIHGTEPLKYGRDILEDYITAFVGEDGEVTGSGAGEAGWNMDIEILREMRPDDAMKIAEFLGRMDVPSGTKVTGHADNGDTF